MNYSDSIKLFTLSAINDLYQNTRKICCTNPELILSETENSVLKIIC